MKATEESLPIESEESGPYGSGSQISVPEFNVVIPEGTTSWTIETALRPINFDMNRTPLAVNPITWKNKKAEQEVLLDAKTAEIRNLLGDSKFRPNASADCQDYFLKQKKYPVLRTTDSGKPSMDQDTIQEYQNMGDPVAGKIVEARKLLSGMSQLNKWGEFAAKGWVQTKHNSLGTPMGRYTTEKPCLQNRVVPIRHTIEAPMGCVLVSADLGQAEYVNWASLSGDQVLSEFFTQQKDLHQEMWGMIHGLVPNLDLHGEPERQFGKMVNFAILYRMQPFELARRLGCSVADATRIVTFYHTRIKVASDYIDRTCIKAIQDGCVETFYGRRRYLPELRALVSTVPTLEQFQKDKSYWQGKIHEVLKTAWHHHNSGTAAEILKIKTLRTCNELKRRGLYGLDKVRVGLNMHDELILIVPTAFISTVERVVMDAFIKPIKGFLTPKIDVRMGKTWGEVSK